LIWSANRWADLHGRQYAVFVNSGTSAVYVIDTNTHEVIATIREQMGRRPWGIAITPDGGKIYTADGLSDSSTVIDPECLCVIGQVATADINAGSLLGESDVAAEEDATDDRSTIAIPFDAAHVTSPVPETRDTIRIYMLPEDVGPEAGVGGGSRAGPVQLADVTVLGVQDNDASFTFTVLAEDRDVDSIVAAVASGTQQYAIVQGN
jgi:YVTN family beta-propeller protein